MLERFELSAAPITMFASNVSSGKNCPTSILYTGYISLHGWTLSPVLFGTVYFDPTNSR